jgi:predicted nucleic acid-binding protein
MTDFVLDNSVTMRWLLASGKTADQRYAEQVLASLLENEAVVPSLWCLEVANVLLGAERSGDIEAGVAEAFLSQLERLPICTESATVAHVFLRTLSLARTYKLSSYDAAYLELAMRESLPLATLDKELKKAAVKAGIGLYQAV